MSTFPASESPRCPHCSKTLVSCFCVDLKWDAMYLRYHVKQLAGIKVINKRFLDLNINTRYIPGGEL